MALPASDALFDPTDEHRQLRALVAQFARDEVDPQAAEYDGRGVLNVALMRRAGELGLLGVTVHDRDCPGFSTSAHIDKLGMRGSTMAELVFEDCRVPAGNLVGDVGGGAVHMMRNLEIERLTLAAMSVGIAERCVEIMIRYSTDRHAFGRPIAEFGQIQRYVADGYAAKEAAKSLVYNV